MFQSKRSRAHFNDGRKAGQNMVPVQGQCSVVSRGNAGCMGGKTLAVGGAGRGNNPLTSSNGRNRTSRQKCSHNRN